MKWIQDIKNAYSEMTTAQLESQLKRSKWGVVAMVAILLIGISLKTLFAPFLTWTTYFDSVFWLPMVALFIFNYKWVRDELASRGEVHA